MIAIRLIGEPDQVAQAAQLIGEAFRVVAVSRPYPCRGADARVRVYIDAEITNDRSQESPS